MADPRVAPEWFVRRLRQFPDFVEVRYNEQLARWEFVFLSAAGIPVSQFYGWERNPLTGAPVPPDPVSGLLPFRDLDEAACNEILDACERTFIGNRADGPGDWRRKGEQARRYNRDLRVKRTRERAEDFAYLLSQMDIRRPGWIKYHSPAGKRLTIRRRGF